jgi:uncharacterized protein involved in response to NO
MTRSLPLAGEWAQPPIRPPVALAAKGFRPFFLGAAAFAATMMPLWLAVLASGTAPSAYLAPATWHAHEMLFGFCVAVIAGFLLTAVGNWTQRETLVGAPLIALAALWLSGRAAILSAAYLPRGVPAAVDLAFLPLLVGVLVRPLVAARNRRQFALLGLLLVLFVLNGVIHLAALGALPGALARQACVIGVDVVATIALIIAGRVLPMFTRNATGVASIRSVPILDTLSVVGAVTLVVADVAAFETGPTSLVAGVTGLLVFARTLHWGAWHSRSNPLLWILHTGHAWIAVGLLLRALSGLTGAFSGSSATHALTVGAIGSLTLGMMVRVALGHTGRVLVASKPVAMSFVILSAAAIVRVAGPVLVPEKYFLAVLISGLLWTTAFAIYLICFTPALVSPRIDGKPG